MENKEITKELLCDLYFKEGLSTKEIAVKVGRAPAVIGRRFKRYGVKLRSLNEARALSMKKYPDGIMKRKDICREKLEELYYVKNFTIEKIAQIFDVSSTTITNRMKQNEFLLRTNPAWPGKEVLYKMYVEDKMFIGDIAKELLLANKTVSQKMKFEGIANRSYEEDRKLMVERGIPVKKDTIKRIITAKGYVTVSLNLMSEKDRELLLPMKKEKGVRILEHRAVMALHLGRPITKKEVVHHINGIKDDNRIENLELFSSKEHRRLHHDIYIEVEHQANIIIKLQDEIVELKKQLYDRKEGVRERGVFFRD